MLRVLILGGYGFFGTRIAKALAADSRVSVLVGGRDARRAADTAAALGLPPEHGIAIDARSATLDDRLRELRVDVVVHAAGPFQDQSYDVARAAIAARCHYIDLADGRAFVAGIGKLDEAARTAGVCVISGASSVPALAGAVVDRYAPRFRHLTTIRSGIAAGARAPGLATVRAIFSYLGKPFTRLENGAWVTTHGWLDLHRHRFPPPLKSRLMSSCDVPDLEVFPARYSGVRTVTFHAGYASYLGHLAIYLLALLVRARLCLSATPFARIANGMTRLFEPIVSHRSGMFVTLEGIGEDGKPSTLTWSLLAAQNHGPQVPCGAAIALVRRLAADESLPVGARPCVGLLSVAEYLAPLGELDVREVAP
jgi:saccharopine dehydrogenase-like NADP-dependent oxidoreductase